jgi:hypothetical protein
LAAIGWVGVRAGRGPWLTPITLVPSILPASPAYFAFSFTSS